MPRQLPAEATDFVDRERHLADLNTLLASHGDDLPRRAAVVGTAGVGKTALALRWAHGARDQYADGELYVNLRGYDAEGPADPEDVLDGFLRALDVSPDKVPSGRTAREGMYRAALASRRMLIVLDNAGTAGQVRPLLPGSRSCAVLITSRSRLTGLSIRDGVTNVDLDLLPPHEAVRLLTTLIGPSAADDPAGTAELASLCAYLPLALRIVAERARTRPHADVRDIAAELRAGDDRLDALTVEDDELTSVRSVLSWSYRSLSPSAAETFRLIGLHPGPDMPITAVAALSGSTVTETRRRLDALSGVHLVDALGRDRYQLHDLLKVYAVERTRLDQAPTDTAAAQRRELTWYLHSVSNADVLLKPSRRRVPLDDEPPAGWPAATFTSYEEAMQWCEAERVNCVASVRRAAEIGAHDIAWKLALALNSFFHLRWHITDWAETATIGARSARELRDHFAEAWSVSGLGGAQEMVPDWDRAVASYEEALRLWRICGDRLGEMLGLHNLGNAYREVARLDESLRHETACLTIAEEVGNFRMKGAALFGLGMTHVLLSRFEEAIQYLRRAIDSSRQCDDKHTAGRTTRYLADVYREIGLNSAALETYREAQRVQQSIGDQRGEGDTLMGLGAAELQAGRPTAASHAWRSAHDIFITLDEPLLRAQAEEAVRQAGLE